MRRFVSNVSSDDVTYHEYKGAHHVLLFCPERHHVMDRMVGWLLSRGSHASCGTDGAASPRARMLTRRRGAAKWVKGAIWGLSMGELTKGPSRTSSNAADVIAR